MNEARIVSDPAVMLGKPVIVGTRITVELILRKLAAGETAEQIARDYPHLPAGAVQAAVDYAATHPSHKPSADALLSRITIDPAICHGKPCMRGLRYPVETLLELLSSGMTFDEILDDYEDLERDDLVAVLDYATRFTRTRRLEPVAT